MLAASTKPDRRILRDRRRPPSMPAPEELDRAIAAREIEILFQPQFAASDGRLVGAEALARWHHPERGALPIGPLFAAAQHMARVPELSGHLARRALEVARKWPVPLDLSLNVTAADVASGCLAATVLGAVEETGFPFERLTLEITEDALVTDLPRSAAELATVAMRGVTIALDDFGAGFCNFHYLKRLPLDCLKLDRSMIDGIDEDPRDLAVLRGILAMAHALSLEVTAEGIERASQRDIITREGCTRWQGFLGAYPMTAAEFEELARG
jgi:EAL domain-containing protein (putative c-di-GMP-specific phosphodiesterase class I)